MSSLAHLLSDETSVEVEEDISDEKGIYKQVCDKQLVYLQFSR